jgi:hypothetical protein
MNYRPAKHILCMGVVAAIAQRGHTSHNCTAITTVFTSDIGDDGSGWDDGNSLITYRFTFYGCSDFFDIDTRFGDIIGVDTSECTAGAAIYVADNHTGVWGNNINIIAAWNSGCDMYNDYTDEVTFTADYWQTNVTTALGCESYRGPAYQRNDNEVSVAVSDEICEWMAIFESNVSEIGDLRKLDVTAPPRCDDTETRSLELTFTVSAMTDGQPVKLATCRSANFSRDVEAIVEEWLVGESADRPTVDYDVSKHVASTQSLAFEWGCTEKVTNQESDQSVCRDFAYAVYSAEGSGCRYAYNGQMGEIEAPFTVDNITCDPTSWSAQYAGIIGGTEREGISMVCEGYYNASISGTAGDMLGSLFEHQVPDSAFYGSPAVSITCELDDTITIDVIVENAVASSESVENELAFSDSIALHTVLTSSNSSIFSLVGSVALADPAPSAVGFDGDGDLTDDEIILIAISSTVGVGLIIALVWGMQRAAKSAKSSTSTEGDHGFELFASGYPRRLVL